MQMPGSVARHLYLRQVGLVAFLTTAFVLVTDAISFRSEANLLWMIGLPAVIAIAQNRTWDRRAFMIMALIGVSLITSMIIGVPFTSYG